MMLDTDVMIDLQREFPAAVAWFAGLPALPSVSGFAAMELFNGCHNSADRRRIEKFLRAFVVLWPSEATMQQTLSTFTPLRMAHGVGMIDSLIAATALQHGQTLATLNVRHFRAVPGLVTVQPYKRA